MNIYQELQTTNLDVLTPIILNYTVSSILYPP